MKSKVKTPILNMVMGLSEALDLVSPLVTGHHKRVAYISSQIAEVMNLSTGRQQDILIAGALHDIGAFSFNQDFKKLFFDINNFENVDKHARLGAKLLKKFPPFKKLSQFVYYHHVHWKDAKQKDIPLESYILHLADRIEVIIDEEEEILGQKDRVAKKLGEERGKKFAPEVLDAFLTVSEQEAFWFELVSSKINRNLKQQLPDNIINLTPNLVLDLAKIFGHIIDFQSSFTATHSSGVAAIAEIMSDLIGLPHDEVKMMKIAGYFHDLGKLVIPNKVLDKEGKLTEQEYNIVKQHPFYTYQILDGIKGLDKIRDWAAFHHERIDGTGYPFKLAKSQLSVQARIMAVADVFTAIMEDRPYREGMSKEQALKILQEMVVDGQLDGELVAVLSANFAEVNQLRNFAQEWEQNRYEEFCYQSDNYQAQ